MIEALSSGLPVVAARSGGALEVVLKGENGLLYEPGSDGELVATIRHILGDGALYAALGRGARASAEKLGWEASTAALRGYYEEILNI